MTESIDWTEDRVTRLKQLFDEGYSGAAMASELAVTRNAAMGKCLRMGWKRPTSQAAILENMHKIRRAVKKNSDPGWGTSNVGGRPAKIARSAAHRVEREAVWKDKITPHDRRIPKAQRKSFWDLTPFTCRYPVGDPRGKKFFFCGATAPFYTYCDYHYKIAWKKPRRA